MPSCRPPFRSSWRPLRRRTPREAISWPAPSGQALPTPVPGQFRRLRPVRSIGGCSFHPRSSPEGDHLVGGVARVYAGPLYAASHAPPGFSLPGPAPEVVPPFSIQVRKYR